MNLNLSVDGRLVINQNFKSTQDIHDYVDKNYGANLIINKLSLKCPECKNKLNDNIDVYYELMTNKHGMYGSNRPQSITYLGIYKNCTNCNKETIFN